MIINLQPYLFHDKLIDVPRLTAKIIKSWLEDGMVDLRTKEGQSFEELGLYELLDSICDELNIPKDKITLTNDNWSEWHEEYIIRRAPFNYPIIYFDKANDLGFDYEGEKFYGLFIGRLNQSRMKARILSCRRFIPALTSLNDSTNIPLLESMRDKLISSGYCSRDEFDSYFKPHSGISDIIKPPIVPPFNSHGKQWSQAYKQIVLEIVLETTDWPGSFHLTEKTLRPIYHKRPFIVVGSKGFMEKMREIGFRTFKGIIDNHYENFDYCVEQAFDCLDSTYARYGNKPSRLLDDCKEDLEHNYSLLLDLASDHSDKAKRVGRLSYYGH